jgi:hypothetical protein
MPTPPHPDVPIIYLEPPITKILLDETQSYSAYDTIQDEHTQVESSRISRRAKAAYTKSLIAGVSE